MAMAMTTTTRVRSTRVRRRTRVRRTTRVRRRTRVRTEEDEEQQQYSSGFYLRKSVLTSQMYRRLDTLTPSAYFS